MPIMLKVKQHQESSQDGELGNKKQASSQDGELGNKKQASSLRLLKVVLLLMSPQIVKRERLCLNSMNMTRMKKLRILTNHIKF